MALRSIPFHKRPTTSKRETRNPPATQNRIVLCAAMERTPIEIWHMICADACTDGGATGRSLALTSRRVREMTRHHRLQSVHIQGYSQTIQFARMLDCTPMDERLVVELCVQFDDDARRDPGPTNCADTLELKRMSMREKIRCWASSGASTSFKTHSTEIGSPSVVADIRVELTAEIETENGAWKNTQYPSEIVGVITHILSTLCPRHALRTIRLRAGHAALELPAVPWYLPQHTRHLRSWILDGRMDSSAFFGMQFADAHDSEVQNFDMAGVVFGRTFRWYPAARGVIAHIARFAPGLVYLRINISVAMVETLPPVQWLAGGVLGPEREFLSLPSTTKMVFVQMKHPDAPQSNRERHSYAVAAERLRNLAGQEHRVMLLNASEHALSLQQLIDRLKF